MRRTKSTEHRALNIERRRWPGFVPCSVFGALCLIAISAYARVGGGESYSGGHDGGGGGGGGGGELVYLVFRLLLWLTVEHPVVGIPIDVIVVCGVVMYLRRNGTAGPATLLRVTTASSPMPIASNRLNDLRRFDPNFSEITFSDFCYSLYGRVHTARGAGTLDQYAPYLSDAARSALRTRNPQELTEVRGVVVGSFRVVAVHGLETPPAVAMVAFESNYTEVAGAATSATSWYVQEQWVLERSRDILSPPPEKAKADHCPRCGAPLKTRTDGACDYCGVRITSGAFQWYVRSITLLGREQRGPLLTSNVPEEGTSRPTVRQAGLAEKRATFERDHPEFQWEAFSARVRSIASSLQASWSSREWEGMRALETESLFQMHRYWIDAYKAQHLRNLISGYRVTNVEPVKITDDAFYEAMTVRLWAEGADYTTDEGGRVVAGSSTVTRQWSEYWTLIRTRSSSQKKINCPNCGASVEPGPSSICPYCGGKITAGEFDWVLSRIEQDEAYAG